MKINHKELEELTPEDLEWSNDLIRQAQICKAEASALEGLLTAKLQNKYGLELRFGDAIDFADGKVTRGARPGKVETKVQEK